MLQKPHWTLDGRGWHIPGARDLWAASRSDQAMSLNHRLKLLRKIRPARLAAAVSMLVLAGCAGDDQMTAQYVERPIDQIYSDAWKLIDKEDWLNAGRQFDEVERQHPYSVWARRAMLMSAFCYYEGNRYGDAIDAAARFIQLHPGNKDVPYAYYLKSISLYEQIGDVNRDQGKTEDAMTA